MRFWRCDEIHLWIPLLWRWDPPVNPFTLEMRSTSESPALECLEDQSSMRICIYIYGRVRATVTSIIPTQCHIWYAFTVFGCRTKSIKLFTSSFTSYKYHFGILLPLYLWQTQCYGKASAHAMPQVMVKLLYDNSFCKSSQKLWVLKCLGGKKLWQKLFVKRHNKRNMVKKLEHR